MDKKHIVLGTVSSIPRKKSYYVGNVISIWLLLTGMLGVEFCFFNDILLYLASVICLFVPTALAFTIKKQKLWQRCLWVMGGITLLSVLINPIGFVNSFLFFINQIISILNQHFSWNITEYSANVTLFTRVQYQIALNLTLGMLCGLAIRKNVLKYFSALGFLLLILCAYLGLSVSIWIYALFIFGVLLVFAGSSIFAQGKRKATIFCSATALICVIAITITSSFTSSAFLGGIKQGILDTVDTIRYGNCDFPEGDMTKAELLVGDKENKALSITTDTTLSETHLRGYVGSQFDGTKWDVLSNECYSGDMAGMLSWLNSRDFYEQYQLFSYLNISGEKDTASISIRNIGAYSKYVYIPYLTGDVLNGNIRYNYDWQILSKGFFGQRSYNLSISDSRKTSNSLYLMSPTDTGKKNDNFVAAESVYYSFVENNYVDIDEKYSTKIKDKLFNGSNVDNGFNSLTTTIRTALMANNTYSDTPDVFNGDDFIDWFLTGNNKCNAASYATMATLAYRTAGYPARYVEGYYMDENTPKDDTVYNLSAADAHAWVEVYIQNMGWIPIEVTPGFYDADFSMQQIAPSPNSSVNVVKSDDDSLKGGTGDSLNNPSPVKGKKTTQEKVFETLGLILLIFIIVLAIFYLLRLQAMLRKKHLKKTMYSDSLNSNQGCKLIFSKTKIIMSLFKIKGDYGHPYDLSEQFVNTFSTISIEEYERFLQLIQKSIFRSDGINQGEYKVLLAFYERTIEYAYGNLPLFAKIQLKYIYAL